MSITLRTDIILDVINAADPRRAAAATRELEGLSTATPDVSFSSHLDSIAEQATKNQAPIDRMDTPNTFAAGKSPAINMSANRAALAASMAPRPDTAGALGALVVQKMIEQMMPKASATTFGSGSAGSIWRSALAEKLALVVAPSIFDVRSLKLSISQATDDGSTRSTA